MRSFAHLMAPQTDVRPRRIARRSPGFIGAARDRLCARSALCRFEGFEQFRKAVRACSPVSAVRGAFANATLIRPAVMLGPDDAFLTTILKLLRRLPVYPLFGRGLTRLQPAYVEDVAEAIARALEQSERHPTTFECGGPRVYSYKELLITVAREAGLSRTFVPVPFAAWQALGWVAELLPSPPLTRNQVELMRVDTGVITGHARVR
jgi:hypothetical protein